jgi:hypothetical protein
MSDIPDGDEFNLLVTRTLPLRQIVALCGLLISKNKAQFRKLASCLVLFALRGISPRPVQRIYLEPSLWRGNF